MQKNIDNQIYYDEDEITLKDIVLKIKDYSRYLWDKKIYIAILAILGFSIMYLFNKSKPITYTSGLTFIISEEQNPASALELSDISDDEYNINRLIALARSSNITHNSLLNEVTIDGSKNLLANHIIDIYEMGDRLSGTNNDQLSSDQKIIIARLHELIAGNTLSNKSGFMEIAADKSKIITLSIITKHSELSDALVQSIFQNLKEYYIDQTIGNSRRTLELLKEREQQLVSQVNISEDNLTQEIALAQKNQVSGIDNRFEVLHKIESEQTEELKKNFKQSKDKYERRIFQMQMNQLNSQKEKFISESQENLEKLYHSILKEEELHDKQQTIDDLALRIRYLNVEKLKSRTVLSLLDETDLNSFKDYNSLGSKLQFIDKHLSNNNIAKLVDSLGYQMQVNERESRAWRIQLRRSVEFLFDNNKVELQATKNIIDSLNAEIQIILSQIDENIKFQNYDNNESAKLSKMENKVIALLLSDENSNKLLNQKITDIRFDRLTSELNNTDGILAELRKNKQTLEFNIKYRTPNFQIIDHTITPIVKKTSALIQGILGWVLGLMLSSLFFIFKRTLELEMAK
ncbi:MAG: hypothetical protein V3V00_03710 [Saprospiraceae bacterium]